jgi:hypothetical protein
MGQAATLLWPGPRRAECDVRFFLECTISGSAQCADPKQLGDQNPLIVVFVVVDLQLICESCAPELVGAGGGAIIYQTLSAVCAGCVPVEGIKWYGYM